MKKILVLLLLLSISTSFCACGQKVLKTNDIFYMNVYKVSSSKVKYTANPSAVLTLGSDRKKVESIMGKGQAYTAAGSMQTVYYTGGLTVLYDTDTVALLDYTLDETSIPEVRNRAFSFYKGVNLSSTIDNITSLLGQDSFVMKTDAKGSPAQMVYAYEMINGEYGHQVLPNSSTSQTDQINSLSGNNNVYGIMLYVDSNPRYQQLYRVKIGKLSDILEFRND